MSFLWPIVWLLLLPALLLWFWRPFHNRWTNRLRLLLYVVVIAALAFPFLHRPDRAGVVVAVVDRSRSMPEGAKSREEALLRQLAASCPADSKLGILSFGGEARIEKLPDAPGFERLTAESANPDASNLAGALSAALQLIPENTPGRILVVTDGEWTGVDPAMVFAQAAARGIAVDLHTMERPLAGDLAIRQLELPLQVAPGEFFNVQLEVVAPQAMKARCRIRRGAGEWRSRDVTLQPGSNRFTWRDRGDTPGVLDYVCEVMAAEEAADPVSENNRARALVEVRGRKPVLLLSDSPSGNLARVLAEAGIPVVRRHPAPVQLTPEKLANYSGVILENVPAASLGQEGMELLAAMVKSGNLGLLITGGRSSFAVGGYYRSPLEELLPVSLEQRQEVRKSTLALVVALDRSGSMAAPIGNRTKMDMANIATSEVLDLLMPWDEFGVIAVDSKAHTVIPLTSVEGAADARRHIRSIESMGGGIFTATALDEAFRMLKTSNAVTRHLLLFADASDAEEPGNYQALLADAAGQGITVSVVGLGSEFDCDAVFLRDIARRGNGLCYFANRADELPRIFAQDTFIVARNTFVDTPVSARYTPAARSYAAEGLSGHTEFNGYNLCYEKPETEVLLQGEDELTAPLAATGQAGLGRVSALMAEADGRYTGAFSRDPNSGTLLAALVNWMRVPEENRDWLLTQSVADGVHKITLHLNPERDRDPWNQPPIVTTLISRPGLPPERRSDPLEWVAPDRLVATVPLVGEAVFLSSVAWDGGRAVPLSPVVLPYSPEFRPTGFGGNRIQVSALSRSTGGEEQFRVEMIWKGLPKRSQLLQLSPFLALIAVGLLLCEVGERRLEWLSRLVRRRLPQKPVVPKKSPVTHRRRRAARLQPAIQDEPPREPPPSEEPSPTPDSLAEALRRARRH